MTNKVNKALSEVSSLLKAGSAPTLTREWEEYQPFIDYMYSSPYRITFNPKRGTGEMPIPPWGTLGFSFSTNETKIYLWINSMNTGIRVFDVDDAIATVVTLRKGLKAAARFAG